jgi:hypothetical protein
MVASQCASSSGVRQLAVGKDPTTPLRQAATTRSMPETRNIGAAISGRRMWSQMRAKRVSLQLKDAFLIEWLVGNIRLHWNKDVRRYAHC